MLRLADAGYPRRPKRGQPFASVLAAYLLTRAWDANANWLEHTRTDWKAADAGDWKTPGGEIDARMDFGRGEPGRVAADRVVAGAWGHVHELDVTEAVRLWHAGKAANHGFLLEQQGTVTYCSPAAFEEHVLAIVAALRDVVCAARQDEACESRHNELSYRRKRRPSSRNR